MSGAIFDLIWIGTYVWISGPICVHIRFNIRPNIILLIMRVLLLTFMALSSGMPGGTGPTAGNGSTSQYLLYLSCVILI